MLFPQILILHWNRRGHGERTIVSPAYFFTRRFLFALMSFHKSLRRIGVAVLVIIVPPVGVVCVVHFLGRKALRKYKARLAKRHYIEPLEAPAPMSPLSPQQSPHLRSHSSAVQHAAQFRVPPKGDDERRGGGNNINQSDSTSHTTIPAPQ